MKVDSRLEKFKEKMDATIVAFDRDLTGIRTGRANPAIVENVKAEAYGNATPINQLASISVTDPRTLLINVWDSSVVKSVADAIRDCGMNFNPMVDDALDFIKVLEKNKEVTEDIKKRLSDNVQEMLTEFNTVVEKKLKDKQNLISEI